MQVVAEELAPGLEELTPALGELTPGLGVLGWQQRLRRCAGGFSCPPRWKRAPARGQGAHPAPEDGCR